MNGPKTLEDAIYAKTFPTHEEVCDFILELPNKNNWISKSDAVMWYSEMGPRQYDGMKSIFQSKGDPEIIKKVGEMLYNSFRDKRQMWAVFYTYMHLVADLAREFFACVDRSQVQDAVYDITKYPLEINWHGIGDAKHGWRN